jgi:hypothetical protein
MVTAAAAFAPVGSSVNNNIFYSSSSLLSSLSGSHFPIYNEINKYKHTLHLHCHFLPLCFLAQSSQIFIALSVCTGSKVSFRTQFHFLHSIFIIFSRHRATKERCSL